MPTRVDTAQAIAIYDAAPGDAPVIPHWPCMTVDPPKMPAWVMDLPACPDPFACPDPTPAQMYEIEQWEHRVFLWTFLPFETCKPPRTWSGGAPPVIYDDGGLVPMIDAL